MSDDFFNPDRRAWLQQIGRILVGGIITWAALPVFVRKAAAMAPRVYREGIHSLEGDVRINDAPAKAGGIVKIGDVVSTGNKSRVIFVVGKDAFLVRDNSRIEFREAKESSQGVSRMEIYIAGKLLSVLGKGEKKLVTHTAAAGVKGTGIYVETELERTYICVCYGVVELEAVANADIRETIKTTHHDSPRYVYAAGSGKTIERAKMFNHSDKELIMLESLVGRRPPFDVNDEDYYD